MTNQATLIEANGCLEISGNLNFVTTMPLWNASVPFLKTLPVLKFDLSKVDSVNSAGLALLLEWQRYAKQNKKSISFDHIPSQLISLAKVAGVEELF